MIISKNIEATQVLGKHLAKLLQAGDIVCLLGDLGAGKTALVKSIASGLKISPEKVQSPTFVLMNTYEGKKPLYHFDLYRLDDLKEIALLGYEEYLYGDGIAAIEWAEKLGDLMPQEYLKIELKHQKDESRCIKIIGVGKRYQDYVAKMACLYKIKGP
ncbi:MAG: tRNA (adenosine(37)-N6)-threonylcarbamoyltransferase complex ATPase subunit type 1 TsaE [Candidatus Omnitrophica bacterium]|nr:tRNA (adenosine(37)-N6)-threonylcarbamoyltransferase complex ATPase subunit type 1 TsaE [Candidatus Omnitrophota bacterium]